MARSLVRSLSILLSIAWIPCLAQAAQITPNPNPAEGTITVGVADATNSETFLNQGTLSIGSPSGALANSGSLFNEGTLGNGGTFRNSGYLSNSGAWTSGIAGTMENTGFMTNASGGSWTNSGHLANLGSFLNSGELTNGPGGTLLNAGQLANQAGATLYNAGGLANDGLFTNDGTLRVPAGGQVGGGGSFMQYGGQAVVDGSLNQGGITLSGGVLNGSGTLTSLSPVRLLAGAQIGPGTSIGTLSLDGGLESSGLIRFEFGGAGLSDVLDVNGPASFLGGTLQFDFLEQYSAMAGDSWDFLFADSIAGWNSLNLGISGLDPGYGYRLDAIDGGMRLSVVGGPPPAVPEPASILLLGAGLAGLIRLRRKFPGSRS